MAELKNHIFGLLIFLGIFAGLYAAANDMYAKNGSSATLDNSAINTTKYTNYLSNWNNQTAAIIGNAQTVPILGASFVLLTGVFQAITLIVGLPNDVISPLFSDIAQAVGIPDWAVLIFGIMLLTATLIAILNVMKGDKI